MQNIGKSYFDSVEIDNPNSKHFRDDLPRYIIEKERHDRWKEMFGDEKTIIVGFHHQWLYGKSFVLVASMILNMNKALNDKYAQCKPFIASTWHNEHSSGNILPRTFEYNNPLAAIKYLQDYISNLFDFELGKYARLGIEGYSLLNNEIDKENPELITKFDMGDCNDGVLILDFTTNKYCFVNIGGNSTVEKLKRYVPVDASTYLKAYYPENEQDCSEDELQSVIDDKKPIEFKQNTTINKKFIKRFKGFKTLSAEELIRIFPANEGEILKPNKVVTPV